MHKVREYVITLILVFPSDNSFDVVTQYIRQANSLHAAGNGPTILFLFREKDMPPLALILSAGDGLCSQSTYFTLEPIKRRSSRTSLPVES
jgi:hypothetical protein